MNLHALLSGESVHTRFDRTPTCHHQCTSTASRRDYILAKAKTKNIREADKLKLIKISSSDKIQLCEVPCTVFDYWYELALEGTNLVCREMISQQVVLKGDCQTARRPYIAGWQVCIIKSKLGEATPHKRMCTAKVHSTQVESIEYGAQDRSTKRTVVVYGDA